MAAQPTKKREFRLDPYAINTLIKAQAGSLQKAALEAIGNAIDAGASSIKITASLTHLTIEDDGKGFTSEAELEQFFETFGFDHTQLDRKIGRFGVGRGQLFHFGKNLWTTHGFTMAVDARTNARGYDLGEAAVPHKGVRIEIELYDPMSFSQMAEFETELKKLCKFSTLPVIYNGKQISQSPQDMKWDAETDDAWIKLDDGYDLKVYSQGLFVQALGSYRFGKGGLVITKPGKALQQNLARNDLLASECDVWKRVEKQIKRVAASHQDKAKAGKTTVTEPMRASLARRALTDETPEGAAMLYETPLFTLTNGKHVRLQQLLACGFVASAPSRDRAADLLMQRKQAMIIAPETLHRFGVESVDELRAKLSEATQRHHTLYVRHVPFTTVEEWQVRHKRTEDIRRGHEGMLRTVFKEKVSELPMRANVNFDEVALKEYSPEEKLAMQVLRQSLHPILSRVVDEHLNSDKLYGGICAKRRELAIATGEGFHACTDGASKIWIERGFLKQCLSEGAYGFVALGNILVHELLHDFDSSSGHDHDHAFFEAYHDITLGSAVSRLALGDYATYLKRGGKAANSRIEKMEKIGLFGLEEGAARVQALQEPEPLPTEESIAAAPSPRKRKMR